MPVQIACNRNWTASVQLQLKKKKNQPSPFCVPFIPTNKIPVISNKGHPPPSHSTSLVLFYVTARKSTASIHTTLIRQTLNKQAALPCHWSDSPISHSTALTPSQITSSKSSRSLTVVPHTLAVENTHTSAFLLAITTQPERCNSHPHPHLRLSSTSVFAPFLVEKKQQHHRQLKSQSELSTVALILTC